MKVFWLDPLNTDPSFVSVLAAILRDAGHEVHVRSIARASYGPPEGVQWTPFARMRHPSFSLKKNVVAAGRLVASYPFNWWKAIRAVRASGAKSVLVTTSLMLPRLDAWAMRMLVRGGVAPVVVVHRPYVGFFSDPLGRRAGRYRRFYEPAARLLFMNNDTRERFLTMYPSLESRCGTMPSPHYGPVLGRVEAPPRLVARLAEWAAGAPVLTYISNMRAEQGFADLLSSLPLIDAELADWRLLVASSTVSERQGKRIEARLSALGFRERCWCRWTFYSLPELRAFLESTSVVVAPYRDAAQSAVLASATAVGAPVVATRVGGLAEAVRSGTNGELAPPGDPAALARAVAKVVGDVERYRRGARIHRDVLNPSAAAGEAVVQALLASDLRADSG